MAKLELAFDILARDKASKVMDNVGGKAGKLSGKLNDVGSELKSDLGAKLGLAGGIYALGSAFAQGVKDAADFEKLQARTASVIKSTGNAAGISVKGVQDLAGSLESLSGVDEVEIINSQNVLATFKQIKNAGPDKVFDDAAKAALNMSVALGTDLQGATLQVGKALNDPIKGLTSLGRAGVQFTQAQKDQIKAMVEAGDTMGAQKMILGELESQFGGAAEAAGSGFAGSMARLQDVVGDSFRQIGQELIPVLTSLAEWLAKNLPGAIADFKVGLALVSDFMQTRVWPVIKVGIEVLRGIAAVINNPVIPVIRTLIEWFAAIATKLAEVTFAVGARVGEIVGFFTGLPGRVNAAVAGLWGGITSGFKAALNGVIRLWNNFSLEFKGYDIPGPGPNIPGFKIDTPNIPTLHSGGTVTPWGIKPLRSDEIMAKLQFGETVLPRGAGGGRKVEAHFYGVDQNTSGQVIDRLVWEIAG